MANITDD